MNHPNLIEKSKWLRQTLLEMVIKHRKGHIPSCFSSAELVLALMYGGYFNATPDSPDCETRDRVIISKGHASMVLYPILADLGFYDKSELETFCQPTALLRMYADNSIPGIESITGSLGHGLGIAAGFALRAKRDKLSNRSWVILGDGECYEGSIWESAMFAASQRLNNLVVIVDRNKLCIMDETENCVELGDLRAKWQAFGWDAIEIDGHDYQQICSAYDKALSASDRPVAIIANTIKGKGISFMENQPLWHNRMMDEAQAEQARAEIDQLKL